MEAGSSILTDGAQSDNVLEKRCQGDVAKVNTDENKEGHFLRITSANAFHGFIEERYKGDRGVAIKYLKRYNALFSRLFRSGADLADEIYNALCQNETDSFYSIEQVKSHNLLTLSVIDQLTDYHNFFAF